MSGSCHKDSKRCSVYGRHLRHHSGSPAKPPPTTSSSAAWTSSGMEQSASILWFSLSTGCMSRQFQLMQEFHCLDWTDGAKWKVLFPGGSFKLGLISDQRLGWCKSFTLVSDLNRRTDIVLDSVACWVLGPGTICSSWEGWASTEAQSSNKLYKGVTKEWRVLKSQDEQPSVPFRELLIHSFKKTLVMDGYKLFMMPGPGWPYSWIPITGANETDFQNYVSTAFQTYGPGWATQYFMQSR